MKIFIISILIVLSSCGFFNKKNDISQSQDRKKHKVLKVENSKSSNNILVEKHQSIDSVQLEKFWINFQQAVKSNNKKEVIKALKFPTRSLNIVLFQYSYICDTLTFIRNENKYLGVSIDKNNVNEYYDFIFCDTLKMLIGQITTTDLISKGIIFGDNAGFTYRIFPKEYMELQCASDFSLNISFHFENNHYKLQIGGV